MNTKNVRVGGEADGAWCYVAQENTIPETIGNRQACSRCGKSWPHGGRKMPRLKSKGA